MSEERIALFDFCGTMINFQSADSYVRYVKAHVQGSTRRLMLETLRLLLVKTCAMRVMQLFSREGYINKKMLLRQIEGVSEQEMINLALSFYRDVIRPNYIPEVIAEVERCRQNGCRLFIVSGGYDIYLKYVAEEFGFEDYLSTRLNFEGGKFTGSYKGDDCMNYNKVKLLREYFGRESLKGCDSVAYSDSRSDVPLLMYCRRGIVVQKNQCPPPSPSNYLIADGLKRKASRCCHGENNSQHQEGRQRNLLDIYSNKESAAGGGCSSWR